MTLGERIQHSRKERGMSQEELGAKLLVSRQTISLWEKDQTVPTIDNMVRLKEILGVSVDALLGTAEGEPADELVPNESYRFQFTDQELKEIHRIQYVPIRNRLIIYGISILLYIVLAVLLDAPSFYNGCILGILFLGTWVTIMRLGACKRTWQNSVDRIRQTTYEYLIYDEYLTVNLYREGEKQKKFKHQFSDIEKIQKIEKYFFLQMGGLIFYFKASELKENSALYSFMYQHPSKVEEQQIPDTWRIVSIILIVASILAFVGGMLWILFVASMQGDWGVNIARNIWKLVLFAPIPIASIVFGFIFKLKRNIIVGMIMASLICIFAGAMSLV